MACAMGARKNWYTDVLLKSIEEFADRNGVLWYRCIFLEGKATRQTVAPSFYEYDADLFPNGPIDQKVNIGYIVKRSEDGRETREFRLEPAA